MTRSDRPVNIAAVLSEHAENFPYRSAVVEAHGHDARGRSLYSHITFRELERFSDRAAHGLELIGVGRGTRTVLMVTPGIDFAIVTFALLKIGAVVVMVDPGMGVSNLGTCLAEAEPEVFIGVPKAHAARLLLRWASSTIKTLVTVGRRLFWGGWRLRDLTAGPWIPYKIAQTKAEEQAAILFTSGSTGVAKGAVYSHGIFAKQVELLQQLYGFEETDVDLATFPLFALFDPALGVTAVIPEMDASRPAKASPRLLVEAIRDHGCTQMFGSPALVDNLSRYGTTNMVELPTLKRVISAGAPARPEVLRLLTMMLPPEAEIHTPYGATEALPVSSIGSKEILRETRQLTAAGGGTCVGIPVKGMDVFIIGIMDCAIETWSDSLVLPQGEIGEIVVKGPIVTRSYYNRDEETKRAKIYSEDGCEVYHRMGDVGRFDAQGRLWFCGRKSHRVETEDGTLFTVPCEAIFDTHAKVYRTALVGVEVRGLRHPVLCVELEKEQRGSNLIQLRTELQAIGSVHPHTAEIKTFLFHGGFPVDVRHNAKIRREELARWAARQLV